MADEELLVHDAEGVRWLTLNRPDVGNALSSAGRLRLAEELAEAQEDLHVRCVVLTGTGRHFCTGADLRGAGPDRPRPADAPARAVGEVARNIRTNAHRAVTAILDCEKPVVACVNGTAAGMGMHLALACDLVVASRTARFIEVFVRRGLVPDTAGAYLLPRLIGVQRTKELMFLGDDVSAEEAERIGLVNRVVDPPDLIDATSALAGRLAAGPTRALALTKWLVNRSLESGRQAALEDESYAQEINMFTEDGQEGVQAFIERRDPQFRGW